MHKLSLITIEHTPPIKPSLNHTSESRPPPLTSTQQSSHSRFETDIGLSGQHTQALKADLTTHIWSAPGLPRQDGNPAYTMVAATRLNRNGEVRIHTDINRAVTHDNSLLAA